MRADLTGSRTVLSFKSVAAGYGSSVVFRDLSFSLKSGEGTCFVGSNGSGKSTAIRCVLGLAKTFSGTIDLDGRDASSIRRHDFAGLGVGYVPQGRGDMPSLTVEENIWLASGTMPGTKAAVDAAFDYLPFIASLRARTVNRLSGGERTLVSLARVLVLPACLRLLLLDEISVGLSPKNQEVVIGLLERLRREGVALLMAEQNQQFAQLLGVPLLTSAENAERPLMALE
jgi:branched-chain amino acid transport system ATP-binding protein